MPTTDYKIITPSLCFVVKYLSCVILRNTLAELFHHNNSCERIINEILKRHIVSYLENNNLISDEHHGGQEGHSTVIAKVIIDYDIGEFHQNHNYTLVLPTDLNRVFDLVCQRTYI